MDSLIPTAEKIALLLKARRERIAVAESSTGGLLSATLLAVPGASAYYLGGVVVYTRQSRRALGISDEDMKGLRSSSEPYAQLLAETVRQRHGADWGLAETGAAGPSGNSYGDAAGHSCIAVSGARDVVLTLETGQSDRPANMRAFALKALETLLSALEAAGPA